jgi:hypothetical protein
MNKMKLAKRATERAPSEDFFPLGRTFNEIQTEHYSDTVWLLENGQYVHSHDSERCSIYNTSWDFAADEEKEVLVAAMYDGTVDIGNARYLGKRGPLEENFSTEGLRFRFQTGEQRLAHWNMLDNMNKISASAARSTRFRLRKN